MNTLIIINYFLLRIFIWIFIAKSYKIIQLSFKYIFWKTKKIWQFHFLSFILSLSLLLSFPPSLLLFFFLPSIYFFSFFSFSQLLLFFLFFSYFFLSLNISHSLFLSSFISLFHPLSFNYTLFLSLSLLFHFSFSLSLFSPRILSMFLSSISVSFPSLYMLCATLHDRESIVGLFGFRFRRVARFLFTATYIAKDDAFYSRGEPLRSFCGHTSSKLNFPSPLAILTLYDSCDTDSLGFFKGWLIYQASFLDRDVENKSMDTQQSVSFPSFSLSSLFHFVSPLLIFSSSHSVQGTIIQWENLNILIISLVLSL